LAGLFSTAESVTPARKRAYSCPRINVLLLK
jgi:hypothetical protein